MEMERMKEKMPTTSAGWTIEPTSAQESGGILGGGKPSGTSPTTGKKTRWAAPGLPTARTRPGAWRGSEAARAALLEAGGPFVAARMGTGMRTHRCSRPVAHETSVAPTMRSSCSGRATFGHRRRLSERTAQSTTIPLRPIARAAGLTSSR